MPHKKTKRSSSWKHNRNKHQNLAKGKKEKKHKHQPKDPKNKPSRKDRKAMPRNSYK